MDTPEKNLMALTDATGIFERYPINEEMLMMVQLEKIHQVLIVVKLDGFLNYLVRVEVLDEVN